MANTDTLREALEKIARQKLSIERTENEGCYEEGYDDCVKIARAALAQEPGEADDRMRKHYVVTESRANKGVYAVRLESKTGRRIATCRSEADANGVCSALNGTAEDQP